MTIQNNGTCPLCDKSAYVRPSEKWIGERSGDNVVCERCGYFRIAHHALTGFEQQRYLLSGLTKRASMPKPTTNSRLTITADNITELLKNSGLPRDLLDHLDMTLEYVKQHQNRGDKYVEYEKLVTTDYPLVFARDQEEFLHFFKTLSNQQLLDEPPGRDLARQTSFRITTIGWQRLRELSKISRDTNRAFVAMSFAPELKPAWDNGIKPALEALNFIPTRIDQTDADDKIDDRITAEIRRSGLLIADFTGHRGGVYFEAGFAMGLGIPVVWTCQKIDFDKTHFDTRQYQHLLWETPEELKEKLVNHVAARIPGHPLP